ncbi:MAG: hypothetical protein JWR09_444 [Mucilaginibacter sp.]|nr:hypothetical protein [Mucilaginibacter sp.]
MLALNKTNQYFSSFINKSKYHARITRSAGF